MTRPLDRPWLSPIVLAPTLVLYRDEEIACARLKRLAPLIPRRPGEVRPPGEPLPRGLRRSE